MMTVTGVVMNRDGILDVLQQPQVGYGAPQCVLRSVGESECFFEVTRSRKAGSVPPQRHD